MQPGGGGGRETPGGPTQYIQAKFLGVCKNYNAVLAYPYGILWVN